MFLFQNQIISSENDSKNAILGAIYTALSLSFIETMPFRAKYLQQGLLFRKYFVGYNRKN